MKRRAIKNNQGFIGILALVVTVVVGGGTIFAGTGIIKKINERGCGSALERWNSGDIYGDLADANNQEALNEALKCKEATEEAIKVSKGVGAIMSASTNVGASMDNVAAVIVDRLMDQIEKQSESKKDNKLPTDIEDAKKDKQEKTKETEKDDSTLDKFIKKLEEVTEEIAEENENDGQDSKEVDDSPEALSQNTPSSESDIDDDQQNQEQEEQADAGFQEEQEDEQCDIGFDQTGSPRLNISCPHDPAPGQNGVVKIDYSDQEGDIESLYIRSMIRIPEYNGEQASEWQKTAWNEKEKCGSTESANQIPAELGVAGIEADFYFEIYLEDRQGNKSETEDCLIMSL